MGELTEESKRIFQEVKDNSAKLASCDNHLFELQLGAGAGRRGLYVCQHCKGTITGIELHWYMVGRAHGEANKL